MIKVILKGGLGNQMFQYAFGKSLSLKHNTKLKIDTTFLETRIPLPYFTIRGYELDIFDIPEQPEMLSNTPLFKQYGAYLTQFLYNKFLNNSYVKEGADFYKYDSSIENMGSKITIEGYWNNYKYFNAYSNEIKKLFSTNKLFDPKYKSIEYNITTSNSVSINIRRGDYLSRTNSQIYVFLDIDYYKKAIDIIRSKIKKPKFFVFSYDDPEWIKTQLKFDDDELVIVGKEYVGEKFKTYLRLISLCKHNIISNSTFAWWGAYLNMNNNKIVVSPEKWTHNSKFENPEDWESI